VATATSVGDAVERLLGRFMWRARRLTHTEPEVAAGSLVQYVSVVPPNRHVALRVLLDALDPESANVVTFTEEGEHEARQALRLLGYSADSPDVRVSRGPATETATLTVLFDEPTNAEALRRSTPTAGDIVVLVPPERVAHLRTMAGGAITPVTSSAAFQSARSAEEAIRDELRGVIRAGMIASQVLQLEPLCSEFDAVEVAAGALYLLQRERQRARRAAATAAAPRAEAATPTPPPGRFTRVYLNVGERDGARRGDIVGAITGEAGIVGAQIGKIDLRESHAIVEVSADIAARVIERLSGTSIRGRRVQAREDREQTGAPRRAREERSGDRSAPRRRPPGEHRGSRTEPREGIERMPRAARESDEWSARADRLRNARGAAADDAAVGGEPGEPR
jgi:ATP-dependent RNA helicase DeaD